MNLLTAEHITKAYSERVLLDDVSLGIQEGEKIGVIGVNGMGKSTLLRILAGAEEPDAGSVIRGRNVKVGYLPQTPVFGEEDTILSAVLSGGAQASPEEFAEESEARAMLTRLGLPEFGKPVRELSGGQKKRAALVRVLLNPADFLVLDEPTNHLDSEMSDWLEEYLNRFRGTLLMVTHDRYFLDRVAGRILEVDRGKVYSYPGSYHIYVERREERLDMARASERKRKSILKTELQWLLRGARARSTKQKAHIQRIEALQAVEAPTEQGTVEMSSLSSRLGRKTLELKHISKAYGGRTLIEDFSYIFLKGDRVGFVGRNGCGKTTLLRILTGHLEPDSGEVEAGQTVKIGYFSQENEYMDESMKAIDYVREIGEYIETPEGKVTASALMERFLFDGTMQWSRIEKLSGGEKRRLYLLRILMGAPNVLVLDEPTNDLDIQTLTILEDYLDSFQGIVAVVSHDRYFLDRTVRRIFAFEEGGRIRQYEGGWSDWQAARQEEAEEKPEAGKSAQKAGAAGKKREGRGHSQKLKFTYKEQREYETIDEEIADLEQKIAQLDASIAGAASQYTKLEGLMAEKEEAEKALDEKMERWVYLNDLAERIEAEK
ncbi:MAG TPA: ABC-F family ATP-binding cassette domain-containing protein [Candidatus Scatomonas pullistercoris]|uniref:ABC-F family ATP-binding cassette domain-containing protein n=1 Tax=Candidatus Scatomonas pullistercoris TaxID=2840920 RepID=A0A9D1P131_9FIRM|nr:ABC-F family ATP-binding cassette domain-containing protein [Candidatus Scatomonas pullistercoris]